MSTYKQRQILKALEGHDHDYKPTLRISGTANASNHLNISIETVNFLAENLDDDGNVKAQALADFTNQAILKELEKRGFCLNSIFSNEDVRNKVDYYNEDNGTNHEFTDEQCAEVLEYVFGDGTGANEEINNRVYEILIPDNENAF